MSRSVFISYSRKDSEFVKKLALDLEDHGATVWFDRSDLHPGADWREALEENVKNCGVFILVVSPDSVKSKYVGAETDWALTYDRPIIPLFYRKTKLTPDFEAKISENQYLMFTEGGYEQNFVDLTTGLRFLKVPIVAEAGEIAERRRQRLGAAVGVRWGQVLGKSFGWALAWAIGWAIYWVVFIIVASIAAGSDADIENFLMFPISGFGGGLMGGLLAGFFTMFVLRQHAASIGWKHMKASISLWGIYAPVVTVAVSAASLVLFTTLNAFAPAACDGGFGECLGQGIGEALGYGILLVFVALAWGFLSILGVGGLAGRRAVRHIRKLEPGILGKQSVWVIIGWAIGGGVATVVSFIIMNALEG